jgi:hypothetical protein
LRDVVSYHKNFLHALRRGNLRGKAVPDDWSVFNTNKTIDSASDVIEILDDDDEMNQDVEKLHDAKRATKLFELCSKFIYE